MPVTLTVTTSGGVATIFTPATGTANVVDSPLTSSNGTTFTGIEGQTPVPVLLGTFTDVNQAATVADFTSGGGSVVVKWGDPTPPETLPASDIAATGSPNGVIFTITAPHMYAEEGVYAYTVTVHDAGGATTIISGTAIIADATLTASPTQPTVDTIEAGVFPVPQFGKPVFLNQPVASFTDANLVAPVSDFTATIDWGDGTPLSAGTITQPAGVGNAFVVTGSHTYADSGVNGGTGTYPIQVFVVDVGGSRLTLTNIANVADRPIVITGQLNPASDSGVSNTDDITNVKQPDFFGTSEAFSHVTLDATAIGGGPLVLIGQVQAGSDGSWNIVSSVPLADGSYVITATAVDQFGVTTGGPTTITNDLVIDTVGPVITNVVWNRLNGQVDYVIQDPSPAPRASAPPLFSIRANYLFTKVHANKAFPGKWIVTNVTVTPDPAIDSYDVAVTFNDGATIRGGFYFFTIRDSSNGELVGSGPRRQSSRRGLLWDVPIGKWHPRLGFRDDALRLPQQDLLAADDRGNGKRGQRRRGRPAHRSCAQRRLHPVIPRRRQPGLHLDVKRSARAKVVRVAARPMSTASSTTACTEWAATRRGLSVIEVLRPAIGPAGSKSIF